MTESILIETTKLASFNKLIQELIQRDLKRAVYEPWELQLLMDFETCRIRRRAAAKLLRRYQQLVQSYFLRGQYAVPPISAFLAQERARRKPASIAPSIESDEMSVVI